MAPTSTLNPGEFDQAIDKAKRIYDAFYDENGRTPEPIKLLVNNSKSLHDILCESEDLFQQWNRAYPGQVAFLRRLDETDAFIRRHCTMVEVDPDDSEGSPPRYQHFWHNFRYTYGQRRARKINDGLTIEMQKLITFILMLALRANVTAPSIRLSASISGRLHPQDSNVADIVRRLGEIKYQSERRQIQAIQLNRDPDISDLQEQLKREWRLLCFRAGFVHPSPVPPLPSGERNLLLSSAQAYQEMVVALTRGTLNSPRSEGLELSMTSTPLSSIPESATEGRRVDRVPLTVPGSSTNSLQLVASPEVEPHQTILGDPALPVCVASFIMRARYVLKLQHWRFEGSGAGRILRWTGTRDGNVLEHHLPCEVIPYTKHSSFKLTERGYSLTFQGTHHIVWKKDGAIRLDSQLQDATYSFVQISDLKQFQEELRDKYLIGIFDIDRIKSCRSNNYGEAGNQDLKLWRSKDMDQIYTLSFYANHVKEHLEFPLHWFSSNISTNAGKRSIQLTFSKRTDWLPESWTRPSSLVDRLSLGRSNAEIYPSQAWSISSSAGSPLASVSTFDSNRSAAGSSSSTFGDQAFPNINLAERLRFLIIEFTTDGEAEDDGSYNRFLKEMERIKSDPSIVE